jgi:hypothetical protein
VSALKAGGLRLPPLPGVMSVPALSPTHPISATPISSSSMRKSVSFAVAPAQVRELQEPADRRTMARFIADFYRTLHARAPTPQVRAMVSAAWEMEGNPDAAYTPAELTVYRVFALQLEPHGPPHPPHQDEQFEALRDLVATRYAVLLGLSEEQLQDLRQDPARSRYAPLLPPFQGVLFSRMRVGPEPLVEGGVLRLQTAHVGSRRPYQGWYDPEHRSAPNHARLLLLCRTCRYIQPFLLHPLHGDRDAVGVNVQDSPMYRVAGVIPAGESLGPAVTLFLVEMAGVEELAERGWHGGPG